MFSLGAVTPDPWPSRFPTQPWDHARLTAGDVVGPDGIVYPDWRRAGVTGGIPDLSNPEVRAAYREFPIAEGADESVAASVIDAALTHAASGGKALVRFAAGTYRFTSPLPKLTASRLVIAGAGMDKTKIEIAPGGAGRALFDTGPKTPWSSPYAEVRGMVARGVSVIPVNSSKGFSPGDLVWLGTVMPKDLPATATMRRRYDWPESKTFYTNQASGHFGRGMLARVASAQDGAVTLDRPVGHDLYADEPVQLRKTGLVEGVGIEDLTIVSDPGVKIDPIWWEHVADSWLRRVAIRKPANWPLGYGSNFRLNAEIRDCVFDGTQADLNRGSTAYLGWSGVVTDCLMVNSKANDLRHMAIFQGAIRCVVRDCVFTGKSVRSPQFHGQFPLDNLVEGCTFDVQNEVWTVDGMATLRHGVQGPRNVLYNSRFPTSQGSAVFFGGVEGHILAYNRWVMGTTEHRRDSPIMAFDRTWNTIIRGNVVQADPRYPFGSLNDASCTGWDVRDNEVHGSNGFVAQGDGSIARNDRNRVLPVDAPLGEPRPEVASIMDWQRQHAGEARLVVVPTGSALLTPGASASLRVTRVQSAPDADLRVTLKAEPADRAKVPESVTIPAGKFFADVPVTGGASAGDVAITAEAEGYLADSERLTALLDAPNPADWLQAATNHRPAGLPAPWQMADFGRRPSNPTTVGFDGGRVTLSGGGPAFGSGRNVRITGRAQLWQVVQGDARIVARLDRLSANAQTGLMIADDAAPVTEATILLSDGTVLSSGANHEYTAEVATVRAGDARPVPVWLRLDRQGGVFTAWRAVVERPSAADWQKLLEVDVYADPPKGAEHYRSQARWDAPIHVGIVLNTTTEGTPATATWSDIRVSGSAPP